MRWNRSLLLGTVVSMLALGTGCISQEELLERLDEIDDDGDGDPNGTDCAPDDPTRSSIQEETPYDGIDNDCGQDGDLVDQDGDGYSSIDYAEWAALAGDDADSNWPASVSQEETDCDDLDATINPAEEETHYDGIDQNCNGDDDEYDRDEDGYVHEDYADDYTGDLPTTDCDDDEETTYPGADDTWYDGVDSDCGLDNDFDQDGDGWSAEGYDEEVADYEDTYDYGIDTDATGDCDDEETATYPGADDDWYDGVDSDCGADNDYDSDQDGWTPDEYADELATYEATYGYGLDTSALGDCDDEDDSVHPQVLEHLGDGIDQDCDGGNDTTAFAYSSYEWDTPRRPHLGADDYNYLLVTAATDFDGVAEVGTALVFDQEAEWGETPYDTTNWHTAGSTTTLHNDLDVVFQDDGFYAATSYTSSSKAVLITYDHVWSTTDESYSRDGFANHQTSTTAVYDRIDLIETSVGDTIALGCGDGVIEVIQGEYSSDTIERGEGDADDVSTSYTDCFVEEIDSSTFYPELSSGTDVVAHLFDLGSGDLEGEASSQPWNNYDMEYIVHEDDWVMYTEPSTSGINLDDGSTSYRVVTDHDIESFDAMWYAGDLYIAFVDTDGLLYLAYGDPDRDLTEVTYDITTEDGEEALALHASVYADANYVMIAHSGFTDTADVVGWTFLGN